MRPRAMAHNGRMGMVPWQEQQTLQARLRLGREGKALSRLVDGGKKCKAPAFDPVVCS
jgi:hypothetical protein